MKKIALLPILFLLTLVTGFDEPYIRLYEPVFMYRSEMEAAVKLEAPQPVRQPGKIYIKDDLVLINEKYRGIHLIDNSDPANPDNFGFIHIDGCIDMAMNGEVLYADNAVDLIAISFNQNLTGIAVTSRTKNVFPEFVSPDGRELSDEEQFVRPKNSILVRWKQK
jgi:hypothetical protein